MIAGLHHVAISVSDLDAGTAFYCDAFGFEVQSQGGWDGDRPASDRVIGLEGTSCRMAMLAHHNVYLEMWEYHAPEPKPLDPKYSPADHGLAHICFQVTDIEAEYERLLEAGMTFHAPPAVLGGGSAAVYGRDPFGNIVEIYQPPPERDLSALT